MNEISLNHRKPFSKRRTTLADIHRKDAAYRLYSTGDTTRVSTQSKQIRIARVYEIIGRSVTPVSQLGINLLIVVVRKSAVTLFSRAESSNDDTAMPGTILAAGRTCR